MTAQPSGPYEARKQEEVPSERFVTDHESGCGDYRAAGFKMVTALGITAKVAVCECGAVWCDHPEAWS